MLLSICYYYVCVRECVYGLCVERVGESDVRLFAASIVAPRSLREAPGEVRAVY